MSYQQVKNLKPEDFKRSLWSTSRDFYSNAGGSAIARSALRSAQSHTHPKKKTGRPRKLSLEDQLLMTLEYSREYRTYFHIG